MTDRTSTPPAPGLREAVAALRWCPNCWRYLSDLSHLCLDMGHREPTANDMRVAVLALIDEAALRAESVAASHPFKDEWSFQRSMSSGNPMAQKPIAPDQPCFTCGVEYAQHAPPALDAATVEQVADALHVIGTCWTAPPGAINREVELEMADALLSALRVATPASGEPATP